MAQIDLKDCVIEILDGTGGTPNSLEVTIGEGNLTYTEKRNIEYVRDRGELDTVREGDEEPVEVKLDFRWDFLRAATGDPPTVKDALQQRGEASAWVSSAEDTCEPYAVDLRITHTPPCGGVDAEVILLSDFRWEQLDQDLRAGTVSVTGKCNITLASETRS